MQQPRKILIPALLVLLITSLLHAQGGDDLDAYSVRVYGLWWFSQPSGSFTGKANSGTFDLGRDFGFNYYSTFSGNFDWRFKRKHHLTFSTSPVIFDRSAAISRTITYQGETFAIGTEVAAEIRSWSFATGYQWDFFRRNHGYLALATQVNLLKTSATLSGAVTVNGQTLKQTASGSFFAPLPIIGPHARWYPLHNSGRLSLDGSLEGMYFFGYGDLITTQGTGSIAIGHHCNVDFGYRLGTRLRINGGENRTAVRLTQKGPVAGLEASW